MALGSTSLLQGDKVPLSTVDNLKVSHSFSFIDLSVQKVEGRNSSEGMAGMIVNSTCIF